MALNKKKVYDEKGDAKSPLIEQSAPEIPVMEPLATSDAQNQTERAESPSHVLPELNEMGEANAHTFEKLMSLPAKLESPSPESSTILAMALNEAARLLIEQLPERLPQVFKETAEQQSIPIWMLLVGLMQKAYDAGEHTAPVLDPTWMRTNAAVAHDHGNAICACGCDESFHRRWPGQLYKDNEHGVRAAKLALATGARKTAELPRPPVGQEPPKSPRSGIFQSEAVGDSGSYDPAFGAPARN